MAGEALVGASGIAAAWERPLIIAAPVSTTAELVRKLRRESMIVVLLADY
jgi:hypothetical protein